MALLDGIGQGAEALLLAAGVETVAGGAGSGAGTSCAKDIT